MSNADQLDAAKMHAEPVTVVLGGKEYRMSRVQARDMGAAAERLRDKRIQAVLRNVTNLRQGIISDAIARAGCTDPSDEDVWAYLESTEGLAFMYWRCLQRHNPQLTEKQVADMLEEDPEMRGVLFAHSGLLTPNADENGGGPDGDEERPDFPVFGGDPTSDGTKEPGA